MCSVRCTSTCLVSKSCLIDALLEGWRTVSRVPTITTTPWATELCFSPGDTSQPTPSRQKRSSGNAQAHSPIVQTFINFLLGPLFEGHVGRRNTSRKALQISACRLPPCAWPRKNCMHTASAAIGWSHLNWVSHQSAVALEPSCTRRTRHTSTAENNISSQDTKTRRTRSSTDFFTSCTSFATVSNFTFVKNVSFSIVAAVGTTTPAATPRPCAFSRHIPSVVLPSLSSLQNLW